MRKSLLIGTGTAILSTILLASNVNADSTSQLTPTIDSIASQNATKTTTSKSAVDLHNLNLGNKVAVDQLQSSGVAKPTATSDGGYEIANNTFKVQIDKDGTIQGLYLQNDSHDTNYVLNAKDNPDQANSAHKWVGDLMLRTHSGDQSSNDGTAWQKEYTNYSDATRKITISDNKVVVSYTPGTTQNGFKNVAVTETYYIDDKDNLKWDISIKNTTDQKLTVGDVGIPLPFKEYWGYSGADKTEKAYEKSVLFHSFVGQNSSYVYANRPSGIGNFLVMTPDSNTDTQFEYQDRWGWGSHTGDEAAWDVDGGKWDNGLNVYYINSAAIQSGNRGYLPNTALQLDPGQTKTYSFNFDSAGVKNSAKGDSQTKKGDMTITKYESQLKSVLYKNNIMDAVSVPGMVIPKNKDGVATGKMYLHTKVPASDISFKYQNQKNDYVSQRTNSNNDTSSNIGSEQTGTAIFDKTVVKNGEQYHIYNIKFHSLGRNNIIVNYKLPGQQTTKQTTLQYYVIDNPENALESHANFMLKTQWNDSSKFYDKIFDDWDFNTKAKRGNFNGPDWNSLGWGDDWGLTHGLFLAAQNSENPNKEQIRGVESYVNTGIWNGLMKNHHNDYRVPDWLDKKSTGTTDTDNYSWRGFAYPHVYNTFFEMYKIEHNYPKLMSYQHPAVWYLEKAYNIMKTLYSGDIAYSMDGLEGESTGTEILNALKENGYKNEAENLASYFQKKYTNFSKDPYPYTSEYPYDNTGEEAVYMLGKQYSNKQMMQMVDMKTRACRGVQPVWYLYDDPVTINGENWWQFQYTASLADTAMNDWLVNEDNGLSDEQLGLAERANYGAKLANLTHINSGQIDSSAENIGAVSWTYQAELGSPTQALYGVGTGKLHNGWRSLSGEADLSVFGALQVLSADVVNDPIFGLTGYGADVSESGNNLSITPEDGLKTKLNLVSDKLSYTFDGDKYTHADISKDGNSAIFDFENVSKSEHNVDLKIHNGKGFDGKFDVLFNDKKVQTFDGKSQTDIDLSIPVTATNGKLQIVKEGTQPNPNPSENSGSSSNSNSSNSSSSSSTSTGSETSSTSSSSSNQVNSSSNITGSSNSIETGTPGSNAETSKLKGSVVYAIKKINLYKKVDFNKKNIISTFKKQKRINRPMFKILSTAKTDRGTLRYKVIDLNNRSRSYKKTGYITANAKYIRPVYYSKLNKSKVITVISKSGANSYKKVSLTGKYKHYKKGAHLKVKKIVKYHLTTRFVLTNGKYVTGNKKLILQY
ncbi:DUF5695 domain-containing protein [Lentilactobacillus sp. Marseille-Q4993]|uniref:DUF5695 domain-containing protein n=1 Tax=Lentilactobacillus sp. Marseille-Q4993 TaxID=3039492 RepID=UPI0024BC7AA0|nr:DUF5695 domain-containing protein [Lentilactobacillus sp. Marseille-Q4993]